MQLRKIDLWVKGLGEYERDLPLLVVDSKQYTPNQILSEMRAGTRIGMSLGSKLDLAKTLITLDSAEYITLAKQRLIKLNTDRPITIMSLSLARPKMSSQDMIIEINQNTTVGKTMVNNELKHMKYIVSLLK